MYSPETPQAWYTVESSMFAAALALSTLRGQVPERGADLALIGAWMGVLRIGTWRSPG